MPGRIVNAVQPKNIENWWSVLVLVRTRSTHTPTATLTVFKQRYRQDDTLHIVYIRVSRKKLFQVLGPHCGVRLYVVCVLLLHFLKTGAAASLLIKKEEKKTVRGVLESNIQIQPCSITLPQSLCRNVDKGQLQVQTHHFGPHSFYFYF